MKALDIDQNAFYSLKIDSIVIKSEKAVDTLAKLAYLYIRSTENVPHIAEHIYAVVMKLNLDYYN